MIYLSHLLWKLNVIGRLMVIRAVIIENYMTGTITNIAPTLTCWTPTRALLENKVIFWFLFYNRESRYAIILKHKPNKSSPADGRVSWITQGTQLWNLYTNSTQLHFHFWIHLVNWYFWYQHQIFYLSQFDFCPALGLWFVSWYFIVISVQQRIILFSVSMNTSFPTNLLLFWLKVWSHFEVSMLSSFMPLPPQWSR